MANKKQCKWCENFDGNYNKTHGKDAGACGFRYCNGEGFEGTDAFFNAVTPFDNDEDLAYAQYERPHCRDY